MESRQKNGPVHSWTCVKILVPRHLCENLCWRAEAGASVMHPAQVCDALCDALSTGL